MRLFTGIAPTPHVLDSLARLVRELQPLTKINWSPATNYHVTTKFIGQWSAARLTELDHALAAMPRAGGFEIKIAGLDFYPPAKPSKVLFAKVEHPPALTALAKATDTAIATLGCAPEARPYSPHLTLARLKNENIEQLRKSLTPSMSNFDFVSNFDFGTFPVTEFHLYLSEPGSVYTRLRTYPVC